MANGWRGRRTFSWRARFFRFSWTTLYVTSAATSTSRHSATSATCGGARTSATLRTAGRQAAPRTTYTTGRLFELATLAAAAEAQCIRVRANTEWRAQGGGARNALLSEGTEIKANCVRWQNLSTTTRVLEPVITCGCARDGHQRATLRHCANASAHTSGADTLSAPQVMVASAQPTPVQYCTGAG